MQRRAISTVQRNTDYLEDWFEKTYQRPSCDPLFLGQPKGFWEHKMLVDLWRRKVRLESELEAAMQWRASAATSATTQSLRKRIDIIGQVFGEQQAGSDAVLDDWDAALMRGEMPKF